jgi:hypothetical protein
MTVTEKAGTTVAIMTQKLARVLFHGNWKELGRKNAREDGENEIPKQNSMALWSIEEGDRQKKERI